MQGPDLALQLASLMDGALNGRYPPLDLFGFMHPRVLAARQRMSLPTPSTWRDQASGMLDGLNAELTLLFQATTRLTIWPGPPGS